MAEVMDQFADIDAPPKVPRTNFLSPHPDPCDPTSIFLYWRRSLIGFFGSFPAVVLSAVVFAGLLLPWYGLARFLEANQGAFGMVGLSRWAILATMYVCWTTYYCFFMPSWTPREVQNMDDTPVANPKRVAVIGGGVCGLTALKGMLEEGHDCTLYEATGQLAGVWSVRPAGSNAGSAWENTFSSTSSLNTGFGDFAIPLCFPGSKFPFHLTQKEYLNYILRYVEFFGLRRYVHMNTSVELMERNQDGPGHTLTVKTSEGEEWQERFDFVIVATGLISTPFIPKYPGFDECKVPMSHGCEYRGPAEFAGKRVLIVGGGETSSDASNEIAHLASAAWMSVRGNTLFLARDVAGYPPDFMENRFLYAGPQWVRWMLLFSQTHILPNFTSNPLAFFWLLMHRNPFGHLPSFAAMVGTTKSDVCFEAINKGILKLVPEISEYHEDGVTFENGERIHCDAILFTTGYVKRTMPFLKKTGWEMGCLSTWYKTTFHPELPDAAFIGYSRGHIGAIPMASEMQARWVALVVSGKRKLPDQAEMRRLVKLDQKNNICAQTNRTNMSYVNHLARYEIGCEPPMTKLFFRDPDLWYRLWGSCISGYAYRLYGPHKNYEVASEVLKEARVLNSEIGYNLLQLLGAPMWELYGNVIFKHQGWLKTALDLWY